MHVGDHDIQQTLDRIEGWYETSKKNPLYAWEAIAHCLNGPEPAPLPDWCLDYLRDAARGIYRLYCGRDFENPEIRITSDDAVRLTLHALGIQRERRKNAFARSKEDGVDMKLGLDAIDGRSRSDMLKKFGEKTKMRRASRGKRLLGVKPKTA
jgi:hypothetical protein